MAQIGRRQFIAGALAGAGGVAASTLLGSTAFAQDKRIRLFWWGNPARDKRTFEVVDLFQKHHPDIAVGAETIGWGDYWTKMATQTAGGAMADVIQMAHTEIHEYVQRGAVVPLDQYVGNGIRLDHYDDGANDVGTIDGKLYGINIGSTSQAIPYNTRIFEEAGVDFNPITWTTDDFVNACQTITDANEGKVTGSEDLSLYIENFEVWVRENGRDLYAMDGTLGMTEDDVRSYWEFWGELRKAGIIEGSEKTVMLDKGMTELGIVLGTTATTFRYANQIAGVQSLMKDPVGAAMVPHQDGKDWGHFVLPSMFWCLSRDSKNVDAALTFINDWITDKDTIRILGVDRGIPPSELGREILTPTLSEVEKNVVDYFGKIQGRIGPVPNSAPKGAGEVREAFMRIGTEVVLGSVPADEAAGTFIDEAGAILLRAS